MNNFKYKKFRTADDTSYIIRETSYSGCPVIFKVEGYDLSILASENKVIDFDAESDKILENLTISPETKQVLFVWFGNIFCRT